MPTKIIDLNRTKNYQSSLPLVIGYFGCVHKKHLELLAKHKVFNILTFKPFKIKKSHELYDFRTRLTYLQSFRPQNILVFSIEEDNLNGKQFIEKYLQKINPKRIVVGSNFCFGKDNCKVDILKKYFILDVIKYERKYSTTKIRCLIEQKKMKEANKLLYEPFFVCSKWVSGVKQGRKIGFPTINLIPNYKVNLPFGSYLSKIQIGKTIYPSVTFIGKSKTMNSKKTSFETHVIGKNIKPRTSFSARIQSNIKVRLFAYVDKVEKFKNINILKTKIRKTIVKAKKYFSYN